MDDKLYRADETRRIELKRIIAETLVDRDDIGFAHLFGSCNGSMHNASPLCTICAYCTTVSVENQKENLQKCEANWK